MAERQVRITRLLSAALAAALTLAVQPALASGCGDLAGARILLAADTADPDVFIWDDRVHLIDFEAGRQRDARWVLAHAVLARAGTPALVIACFPGVVTSRAGGDPDDAVGVKVVAGSHRGRFGWVSSSDAQRLRAER